MVSSPYYLAGWQPIGNTGYFLPGSWSLHAGEKAGIWLQTKQFIGYWWVNDVIPLCGMLLAYEVSQIPRKYSGRKEGVDMKRLATIFGIMILATVFAVPAYAMGGDMGGGMGGGMTGGSGGGGMMSSWGSGLLDRFQKWRNGGDYALPPVEERKQMEELDQQHDEDSAYLKYQIRMKEKQLDALLASSDPDIQKARALSKGIRQLRDEADREQHAYEREISRMNSGYRYGDGSEGRSYGPTGGGDNRGMGYGAGRMGGYRSDQ
jgi:hypothetical protein